MKKKIYIVFLGLLTSVHLLGTKPLSMSDLKRQEERVRDWQRQQLQFAGKELSNKTFSIDQNSRGNDCSWKRLVASCGGEKNTIDGIVLAGRCGYLSQKEVHDSIVKVLKVSANNSRRRMVEGKSVPSQKSPVVDFQNFIFSCGGYAGAVRVIRGCCKKGLITEDDFKEGFLAIKLLYDRSVKNLRLLKELEDRLYK